MPYNPYLLLKFQCHINVEVCTSIKAIKYIYKYTYKGPDRDCMEVVRDEIAEYIDARYLSAPEACWRLFGFQMQARSHPVERLPVHLPFGQTVLFEKARKRKLCTRRHRRILNYWLGLL